MDADTPVRSFSVATLPDGRTRLTLSERAEITHQYYPSHEQGFLHAVVDGAEWSLRCQAADAVRREGAQ